MGLSVGEETCTVCSQSRSTVGQYDSNRLDQQRHVKGQACNGSPTGTVLEICHSRFPDNMCAHTWGEECNRRCCIQIAVQSNPTAIQDQQGQSSASHRMEMDREAKFYMNSSLASSSRSGKISQMRSFARFALIMGVSPLSPSEHFLIQYVCFLARTLPLNSILGYLDGMRILQDWSSLQFDWSKKACPRLHLVLLGIGHKGVSSTRSKKSAFGVKELRSLKDYCCQFGLGSVQRAAWVAIIVSFWGCLRSDNVVPKSVAAFDPYRQMCLANMSWIPEGILVVLGKTKTRSSRGPSLRVLLPLLDNLKDLCPVRTVNDFLSTIPSSISGPLLLFRKGSSWAPLLYRDLRVVILKWSESRGYARGEFGSHSARSGAATAAFRGGVGSVGIKKLGDWLSDTFLTYVRQDILDLMEIQSKMLSALVHEDII